MPDTKPKSVLDKVIYAIRQHPPTASGSVSRNSIAKYLKSEFNYDKPLKLVLKKAVDKGILIQTGQSFRVAGDEVRKIIPMTVDLTITKEGASDAAVAAVGDTVVMAYEGRLAENGHVFDKASTFDFVLGAGDVIKGWDQGIVGMKVGEKRHLKVPSSLGYGKRGSAPDIPPNADLEFDVTLKSFK